MTKQITEAIHNLIAVLSVFSGDSITLAAIDEGKRAIENVEKLRAALKPFAERAEFYETDMADETDWIARDPQITIGDLRRAREALGESE